MARRIERLGKIGMNKNSFFLFLIIGLVVLSTGCIEEFNAETQELETLLVVEALITDVAKQHEVQLSRVFAFENEEPVVERNASVSVKDDLGVEYLFEEIEPGLYRSQTIFAAERGKSYQLRVTTSDGENYSSREEFLPESIPVGEIRAERFLNDDGEEGVGIFLEKSLSGSTPGFFRYEFDETYKIIAPNWEPFRFEVVLNTPCIDEAFVVDVVSWEDERKTCFGTSKSERLILNTTVDLQENANNSFQLHFLSRDNYIISHRYSINVTQYSQTPDAFSFYERLRDFSSRPDVFSQVQPGFLEGNIMQDANSDEKILGYFEVASVSEKRMYFNYADLFPGESLPPYPTNCETFGNPQLFPEGYTCFGVGDCEGQCVSPLITQIDSEAVVYAGIKEDDDLAPYFTWPSPCGDCTELGSNIVPEFWSEE